jgi:hypothetical protein
MIAPEAIAASSLRALLLRGLPAQLAAIDALRAPALVAPLAGPYAVPAGAKLRVRASVGDWHTVSLEAGARTASAIAAELMLGAFDGVASADDAGRLVLTGPAPSTATGSSSVQLDSEAAAGATSGTHAVFGWDAGGNRVVRSPLVAPTYRSVYDGLPVTADFAGGGTVNIIIGDRRGRPSGNIRREMWDVELDVWLYRADPLSAIHASRDGIQGALAALRGLVVENRQLDGGTEGVMLTQEVSSEVAGQPVSFEMMPQALFDRARVSLSVRVYASS